MDTKPELAVGLEAIDDHHRELLSRVGQLALALRRGDRGEVLHLVDFLRTYVNEHFALEEQEMLRTGYPRYAAHKAAHDRFVVQYQKLARSCAEQGATPELADHVQQAMTAWLQDHILTLDRDLATWLMERGGVGVEVRH